MLIPWLVSGQAVELGYTKGTSHKAIPGTEHRNQTRYFYLFLFFRLVKQALEKSGQTYHKEAINKAVKAILADYKKQPSENHVFKRLLTITDEAVYTFMELAKEGNWYSDRNAFLKRDELTDNSRIIQATAASSMKLHNIGQAISQIINQAA